MSMDNSWVGGVCERAKPYLGVILLQFGYAGMSIVSKVALNNGMSQHVLAAYRHAVAFIVIAPFALLFDRNRRPKMTWSIFMKIALLGLLEPTIDQNLYYTGMKLTTASFAASMCNILPAFAFILAWIFRFEKVNIRRIHCQAKIIGTIVTVGGAMVMTLINGAVLDLPWTKGKNHTQESTITSSAAQHHPIKGALMIITGCFCWAGFVILQANTLKSYPPELSLTALICLVGAFEGTVLALILERGKASVWAIHFDVSFLAVVYSGVICSGIAYYIQGVVMKSRGPVFVTAFSPLSMVIVAVMSSFLLAEIMYLGRVVGAIVIVIGLYIVLWGKSKDPPCSKNRVGTTPSIDDNQDMATISNTDQKKQMSNQDHRSVALDVNILLEKPHESV